MENELLVVMDDDPEEGVQTGYAYQTTKTNEFTKMCEIPIKSEHCAASLSLADANITEKRSNDNTETATDHFESAAISEHPPSSSRRSFRCWGIYFLSTFTVILLSVIIGISARRDAVLPRPEYSSVVEYLNSHNISSYEELTTVGSPQHLAAQWLAESDPARLPVPDTEDYLYVTRYVMALNYFALDGEGWTMDVNFLTAEHVCDWNGVKIAFGSKGFEAGGLSCDENRIPDVLDLGKSL